jgi:hypothetical protein
MRKMILLAAMAAIAALMLAAAPALADDNRHDDNDRNHDNRDFCDFHDCNGNDFCDFHDCNRNDFCDFHDCNNFVVPEISQDLEQEAESGDVNQSFNVTGGGDNSNQCVGGQQVANTGNAQNQISVLDAGGFDGNNNRFFDNRRFDNRFFDNGFNDGNGFNGGDVEFDDTGASIDVSPTNTTSCDQQVNQAASATG